MEEFAFSIEEILQVSAESTGGNTQPRSTVAGKMNHGLDNPYSCDAELQNYHLFPWFSFVGNSWE